jgi:very-short-patch-repair endonuclease
VNRNGWAILRFWNVDVLTQTEAVTETILAVLDGRLTEAMNTVEMRFIPWR